MLPSRAPSTPPVSPVKKKRSDETPFGQPIRTKTATTKEKRRQAETTWARDTKSKGNGKSVASTTPAFDTRRQAKENLLSPSPPPCRGGGGGGGDGRKAAKGGAIQQKKKKKKEEANGGRCRFDENHIDRVRHGGSLESNAFGNILFVSSHSPCRSRRHLWCTSVGSAILRLPVGLPPSLLYHDPPEATTTTTTKRVTCRPFSFPPLLFLLLLHLRFLLLFLRVRRRPVHDSTPRTYRLRRLGGEWFATLSALHVSSTARATPKTHTSRPMDRGDAIHSSLFHRVGSNPVADSFRYKGEGSESTGAASEEEDEEYYSLLVRFVRRWYS